MVCIAASPLPSNHTLIHHTAPSLLPFRSKAVAEKCPDHRRGLIGDIDAIADSERARDGGFHLKTDLFRRHRPTNQARRKEKCRADRAVLIRYCQRLQGNGVVAIDRQRMTPSSS